MSSFLVPDNLYAIGTAVAGVALFGVAPYLPSLFPPSFARMVGFGAFCAALVPLWVFYGSWVIPGIMGVAGLLCFGLIHLLQTRARRADDSAPEAEADDGTDPHC